MPIYAVNSLASRGTKSTFTYHINVGQSCPFWLYLVTLVPFTFLYVICVEMSCEPLPTLFQYSLQTYTVKKVKILEKITRITRKPTKTTFIFKQLPRLDFPTSFLK